MGVFIHPTAVVDPRAKLGDGVAIGPYCVVGGDVSIGADTKLENNVTIVGHVSIGERNRIYTFCVIGGEPQDIDYHGEPTRVEIGDDNIIRESVTIHRATMKEEGVTRVGSHNFIMANCHIAHDCNIGSHVTMANAIQLGGHVHVQDYAALSGMIGVHHFATIGAYCFIGGMSRIPTDVPPYMLVEGNPAVVRCVNLVGLRRRGFSAADIRNLSEAHRLIFRVKMNIEKARQILVEHGSFTDPVQTLFAFLAAQHGGKMGRAREKVRKAA